VIWIRAEDGGVSDLADLATTLGLPIEGLPPSEQAQLTLAWLSRNEQPWLLVLDNIESPAQLQRLLPRTSRGRILVTSRDRRLREFGRVLTIDVFDEDTATAYLADRADRPDDETGARELAAALGYLPLALSHAAAYCQTGTTFAAYHELLAGLPARELFDFDDPAELSYAQTVASTWKPSIQAATTDAPLAARVLAMAAHLAPESIPTRLFNILLGDDSTLEIKRLRDALNALSRYSLATLDRDNLSVHRLVQKTVRDETLSLHDDIAATDALASVDMAFPSLNDTALPASWPHCELLVSHALALADSSIGVSNNGQQLIGLLNRSCRYLYHAGGGLRAVAAAEITAARAAQTVGTEHPDTIIAHINLANAYCSAGRTKEAVTLEALTE
jgi:hypothetical protein